MEQPVAVEKIDLRPAQVEMLQKMWQPVQEAARITQEKQAAFNEFVMYLKKDLDVPDGYVFSPDGKSFMAPPKPPAPAPVQEA